MKKCLFLLLALAMLAGCESKKTCPICMGTGSFTAFGQEQTCFACGGEKEVSEDDYERLMEMKASIRNDMRGFPSQGGSTEPCPFCGGQGSSYGTPCGYCSGTGRVSSDAAARGSHVVGGGSVGDFGRGSEDASSDNAGRSASASRDRICPTCGGSSRCPVCNGAGESTSYGGSPRICQFCYGQGECPKCMGSGTVPDGV